MMIYKYQDSPNVNWFKFKKKKNLTPNFPNVLKTFMGRDALNIFLWNIKDRFKIQRALIPAYICPEVPQQFKRNNIDVIYYDIKNFLIDQKDIEPFLEMKFDIFYFVHYFGIYQRYIQDIIKQIKERNPNVIIIEDRAHYLSDKLITDDVDAVIYSFRKLLPIPEGGGIYTKQKLFFRKRSRIYSNILATLIVLKKKFIGHNPKFSRENIIQDSKKESNLLLLPSNLSQRVIDFYDLEWNINFRKELFNMWLEESIKFGIEPVFHNIGKYDIPQGFPIFVHNSKKVFTKMLEKGIYLKRHWELPEEIKSIAPNSYSISNKIITLPIYENINKADINFILSSLKYLI